MSYDDIQRLSASALRLSTCSEFARASFGVWLSKEFVEHSWRKRVGVCTCTSSPEAWHTFLNKKLNTSLKTWLKYCLYRSKWSVARAACWFGPYTFAVRHCFLVLSYELGEKGLSCWPHPSATTTAWHFPLKWIETSWSCCLQCGCCKPLSHHCSHVTTCLYHRPVSVSSWSPRLSRSDEMCLTRTLAACSFSSNFCWSLIACLLQCLRDQDRALPLAVDRIIGNTF